MSLLANMKLPLRCITGHSLGGAVATLALLRLLEQLPPGARPAAKCVNFACPAIGNAALAELVRQRGWEACFSNFLVPGALCNACSCHAAPLHNG